MSSTAAHRALGTAGLQHRPRNWTRAPRVRTRWSIANRSCCWLCIRVCLHLNAVLDIVIGHTVDTAYQCRVVTIRQWRVPGSALEKSERQWFYICITYPSGDSSLPTGVVSPDFNVDGDFTMRDFVPAPQRQTCPARYAHSSSSVSMEGVAYVDDMIVERDINSRVVNVNLILRFLSDLDETNALRVFPAVCGDIPIDDRIEMRHMADWEIRFINRPKCARLVANFAVEHLIFSATSAGAPLYGCIRLKSLAYLYHLGVLEPCQPARRQGIR